MINAHKLDLILIGSCTACAGSLTVIFHATDPIPITLLPMDVAILYDVERSCTTLTMSTRPQRILYNALRLSPPNFGGNLLYLPFTPTMPLTLVSVALVTQLTVSLTSHPAFSSSS